MNAHKDTQRRFDSIADRAAYLAESGKRELDLACYRDIMTPGLYDKLVGEGFEVYERASGKGWPFDPTKPPHSNWEVSW
jgi:hypothetical protein